MRKLLVRRIGLLAAIAVFTTASAFTSLAAKEKLDTPTDLYWSATSKDDDEDYDEGSYAKWDEVENANRYRIELYCEDENGSVRTMDTATTKNTKYNFRSKMTREGDYYFRVRAESTKSDYTNSSWSAKSDTYYVSAAAAENAANGAYDDDNVTAVVVLRDSGEWVTEEAGRWYKRADGTYPANGWFQDPESQKWFCFDENGYVRTGFIQDADKTYYCDPMGDPYGAMVTGVYDLNGVIYTFDDSGALVS